MWLKNATIYGISPKAQFPIEQLQAARFTPVGSSELQSVGFSPVHEGELAYRQGKHTLLRFTVEKKHIPGSALAVMVEDKAAALEKEQGFPPGKKARKELKERALDELLPRALSTRRTTQVWIDQDQHRIVVDSTSPSVCDEIVKALIKLYPATEFQDVSWPRTKVVTAWVGDEPPAGFTIDDAALLQYPGEKGKRVKFDRANLDSRDVQTHLEHGAHVDSVAMTFESRLSFIMTDNMCVRRIKPLDIVQEGRDAEKDVDRFAGDVALMTRELGCLFDALVREA